MLSEKIIGIQKEGERALSSIKTMAELEMWEVKYLGRKSELSEILKGLKDLASEEKRVVGPLGNAAKESLMKAFEETKETLFENSIDWERERIDVTAPGTAVPRGHLHPITLVEQQIEDIFVSLGFTVVDGPEVDKEWYNFDALNIPRDHPARDMQDTFWIKGEEKNKDRYLPRTHTSNVQVRYMEAHTPPLRIIIPGRIFRNEATDASHEHTFHQFECLMVDKEGVVSVATFKHIAETFFSQFFGKKVRIRLRPSFFPFTEPSFEFDINCILCDGKGCPVCKQAGWLEIGGAGMVNQKVFEAAGYPRGKYQGFAWGFGVTRLAMMKYKITDIRLMMSGDLRFIRQF
ncbi:MAG: phenylalanine--tRNA ligase subunit alpha [Candidatus Moranbacteria bacterium]|nr:phenylalanine--tRNA ligase subunit alpha [Candidatus Moranbacteria bacterium]